MSSARLLCFKTLLLLNTYGSLVWYLGKFDVWNSSLCWFKAISRSNFLNMHSLVLTLSRSVLLIDVAYGWQFSSLDLIGEGPSMSRSLNLSSNSVIVRVSWWHLFRTELCLGTNTSPNGLRSMKTYLYLGSCLALNAIPPRSLSPNMLDSLFWSFCTGGW